MSPKYFAANIEGRILGIDSGKIMTKEEVSKSKQEPEESVNEQSVKRKDCVRYGPAEAESTKYRVVFSLYCIGGFAVLGWVYTGFETSIPQNNILGFPYWLLFLVFGVPLFGLMYWRVKIIGLLRIRECCQSRAVVVFVIFMATMGLSLLGFGLNVYIITHVIMYSVVLALIDAVRAYREDFSFLPSKEISEAVKLAKLQMMHERWFRYLITVVTTSFGVLIGYGITWILKPNDEFQQAENAKVAVIILGYLFFGIGLGVVADMLNKMKSIEGRILQV